MLPPPAAPTIHGGRNESKHQIGEQAGTASTSGKTLPQESELEQKEIDWYVGVA
jgi:hypothetical protein